MVFNKENCIIRKIYCGDKSNIPRSTTTKKYSRKGSSYECMKRGYGIADWEHRKKELSANSLQQIPYVGEVYEANFKKAKIGTINNLLTKMRNMTADEKNKLLRKVCKKKNNQFDQKTFNCIVLFLHERGITNLPSCKVFSE